MQTSDLNSPVISQRLLAQHEHSSPGIDKLIQKAEFENSEQVNLIETEKQRYAALLRQLEEKTCQVEELEKSTTQLDEEAKQMHKQFTQNREICESLKRTNSVLQEHEEALQKRKEMVLAKTQQSRLENEAVLEKYQAIWDRYKTQYESKANATELSKIKTDAMQEEEELEKIRSTVQKLQTGISSMEIEKKNIEETLSPRLDSLTTRRAQLNLETRKTTDSVNEITTKVKRLKEEQARMSAEKERQQKSPEKAAAPFLHTPLRLDIPVRTTLQLTSPHIERRPSTSQPTQTQPNVDMEVEGSKDEGRTTAKQQQDEVLPDRHISRMQQNEQLLAVTSSQQPSRSFAEAQAVQTTSTAHGERIIQQQLQMPSNGSSVTDSWSPFITSHHSEEGPAPPTTPTSAYKHNSSFIPTSEATNSPFNFEVHSNFIQQLTKSPGDGFLFQSRPMFGSPVEGDKEQGSTENTNFLFDLQEMRNFPGPTGSASGEFHMLGQNSGLFGSPVSTESRAAAGFFGTNPSLLNSCRSIFGEPSSKQSNQQQTTTGPTEFNFSFGAKSPSTCDSTPNRSATFSLF